MDKAIIVGSGTVAGVLTGGAAGRNAGVRVGTTCLCPCPGTVASVITGAAIGGTTGALSGHK